MRRLSLSLTALAFLLASASIDAQPSKSSGPLASGLAALAASDYAKAESELAQVKGAAEPEARLALGRAAFEQGKYADAEKHALAAAASPALKAKANILRAEILLAQGKQKEALALLRPFENGKTADARRAKLLIGETLIAMGRRADADEPLKKVIEDYNDNTVTSTDAEGLAQVGRAAFLLRSPKDANTAFKESERADR